MRASACQQTIILQRAEVLQSHPWKDAEMMQICNILFVGAKRNQTRGAIRLEDQATSVCIGKTYTRK